jgi:hypothetical protein
VIRDDEAFDQRTLDEDRPEVRSWRQFRGIVVTNCSAQRIRAFTFSSRKTSWSTAPPTLSK